MTIEYDQKKGTPCCNDFYDLIYEFHFKFSPHIKQWKCGKCGIEYTEDEMFKEVKNE